MQRYIEIYSIMLRNSLIRDLSFKANFLLWMAVEILWFCGHIVFFSIIFGNVDHIGDWTKWEVVLLIGTHQIIAQLFQAFFFVNLAKDGTDLLGRSLRWFQTGNLQTYALLFALGVGVILFFVLK